MTTGMYFRAQRAGVWTNVEIEHLTDEERREILLKKSPEWNASVVSVLCDAIRSLEKEVMPPAG